MSTGLGGRVAVVTGVAHGFGRAISVGLAENGADVVLVDLAQSAETAAEISRLGKAVPVQADVTNEDQISSVRSEIEKNFGRCDILVNNAGAYPFRSFDELDYAFWKKSRH